MVREGLSAALAEAESAGCKALQLLPFRRHHPPADAELAGFRAGRERLGLERLVVHSRFVPSLASSDPERRERSVELLRFELGLAEGLGADCYILHAGAHSEGATAAEGLALAADSISRAADGFKTPLVIENVPGGGRRLCGPLEELAALRDRLKIRSGVCLDTAHAWAQGYELATAEGMLKFLALAHRLFGGDVSVFHVNDTRALLGSHKEDHAHWGEGYLGREGVAALLARPEYARAVGIVETPKEPGADRRNLDYLAALRR